MLTSKKIFETDDEELMKCIPCHGKDEETFFNTLFGILENQTGKVADMIWLKMPTI